jgi:hypothetical protein
MVCHVCRKNTNRINEIMFTIRGKENTPHCGRILVPHTEICDACAENFEHAMKEHVETEPPKYLSKGERIARKIRNYCK